jgi:hypothetical protein
MGPPSSTLRSARERPLFSMCDARRGECSRCALELHWDITRSTRALYRVIKRVLNPDGLKPEQPPGITCNLQLSCAACGGQERAAIRRGEPQARQRPSSWGRTGWVRFTGPWPQYKCMAQTPVVSGIDIVEVIVVSASADESIFDASLPFEQMLRHAHLRRPSFLVVPIGMRLAHSVEYRCQKGVFVLNLGSKALINDVVLRPMRIEHCVGF